VLHEQRQYACARQHCCDIAGKVIKARAAGFDCPFHAQVLCANGRLTRPQMQKGPLKATLSKFKIALLGCRVDFFFSDFKARFFKCFQRFHADFLEILAGSFPRNLTFFCGRVGVRSYTQPTKHRVRLSGRCACAGDARGCVQSFLLLQPWFYLTTFFIARSELIISRNALFEEESVIDRGTNAGGAICLGVSAYAAPLLRSDEYVRASR